MRGCLLGFLLTPALLLAQSTIGRIGEVTVASVDVTSGSEVSSEHLLQITKELQSHPYPPGREDDIAEIVERARYRLQSEGYFKADVSLNDVQTLNQGEGTIAVTLSIREGRQYRLGQIRFSGNKELSESNLRQQFPIADGDIFDTEQIRKGLEQIRKLYVSRGYINFSPVPNTEPDDESNVIVLKIDCDEGKQFYFGELVVAGHELHPGDGEKILSAWKAYEGRVYNGDEVEQFWREMSPYLPLGWQLEQHLEIRQNTETSSASLRIVLPGANP